MKKDKKRVYCGGGGVVCGVYTTLSKPLIPRVLNTYNHTIIKNASDEFPLVHAEEIN